VVAVVVIVVVVVFVAAVAIVAMAVLRVYALDRNLTGRYRAAHYVFNVELEASFREVEPGKLGNPTGPIKPVCGKRR
jgi:hypothetical protein